MKNLANTIFEKSPDVAAREIGGTLFLVPIRGNVGDLSRVYKLNASAAFIWKHIDGQNSVEDILSMLKDHFDGLSGNYREEAIDFIENLLKLNMVKEK